METLTIPVHGGIIFVQKKGIAVIPVSKTEVSNKEVAIAVTLLRWGVEGVQLLLPKKARSEDQMRDMCATIQAMCDSLAHKEKFTCMRDPNNQTHYSFCIERVPMNGAR